MAAWLVAALALYALLGAAFGLWFVASAIDRFDPAARGAGPVFRLLVLPGTAALWPVLLRKWMRHGAPHD